jgi:hypothetical protein
MLPSTYTAAEEGAEFVSSRHAGTAALTSHPRSAGMHLHSTIVGSRHSAKDLGAWLVIRKVSLTGLVTGAATKGRQCRDSSSANGRQFPQEGLQFAT